mmetsp:Transcript_12193/g.15552  ORF Transcript_12193/g.15552 Transcript_12193/m.15552 type:complete len:83 (+) Transcript_12193:118-366(+)
MMGCNPANEEMYFSQSIIDQESDHCDKSEGEVVQVVDVKSPGSSLERQPVHPAHYGVETMIKKRKSRPLEDSTHTLNEPVSF